MKQIVHVFILLIILFLLTVVMSYGNVILNFDQPVIPDQSLTPVPIGDLKNETQYNTFKLATSDNYILLLTNSPWQGVWSAIRLTHYGELVDTIPKQLRVPEQQTELNCLDMTWSAPYLYIWELHWDGDDYFLYYTRFTEDLSLIDEAPRFLCSYPYYLAWGGDEAWTMDKTRRVWGYSASTDSVLVDGVEITGWKNFTGTFRRGLVDDGLYITRTNPIDTVTDIAYISKTGEVKVLAPAQIHLKGIKFSSDSALYWGISVNNIFQYYFVSKVDSLASETLHEIDLSPYFSYSSREAFTVSGNHGILAGATHEGADYQYYVFNIDLLSDSIISFEFLNSHSLSLTGNPLISQVDDTSSIFFGKYNGIEMTRILSSDLSIISNPQPVLYGLGYHSNPSMIKDSLGLLIYLGGANENGTYIYGYRFNEPLVDNLQNPSVCNPHIADSATANPNIFNVDGSKGLFWMERLPDDNLGTQSKLYEQKMVLFSGDKPSSEDLSNTYILDTTQLHYRPPVTVKIRDTLYIMSIMDSYAWALRSIDLINEQKTSFDFRINTYATPILKNDGVLLHSIGLYNECVEYISGNLGFCISWRNYLHNTTFINDFELSYFESTLPGGNTYYEPRYTPLNSLLIDGELYIGVADPPAIMKMDLSNESFNSIVDFSNLIPMPSNISFSKPHILIDQYQNYKIAMFFNSHIDMKEAFIFDEDWNLISQQEIPVLGAIQDIGGVELSSDSSTFILAYTSYLPYPYSSERLILHPFEVDLATDIEDNNDNLPSNYYISQNYPNPFNLTTKIEYEIPRKSHVLIRILNILGREVTTLVDEEQSVGSYSKTWDGIDSKGDVVASGVYLYKLEADDYSITKKMILLK